MLHDLLHLIGSGRAHSSQELAQALRVSPALVSQMIEQLICQGYLSSTQLCGSGCSGCALKQGCRLWSLTGKGQAIVERAVASAKLQRPS
ncbi:MAG: MarR family transcriptional regulator [Anaerolineae bacterium]|nr:MarR family transcriptional regulator [Anaerolineae bacterium]